MHMLLKISVKRIRKFYARSTSATIFTIIMMYCIIPFMIIMLIGDYSHVLAGSLCLIIVIATTYFLSDSELVKDG